MHIGVKMSCPSLLHATFSKAKNCWKPVAYSKCTPKRGAQSVRRSVMMGLMSWSTVSDKTCEKSHTTSLTCSLQCHVTGCIISIMSVVCLHFYLCHPLNFLFFFLLLAAFQHHLHLLILTRCHTLSTRLCHTTHPEHHWEPFTGEQGDQDLHGLIMQNEPSLYIAILMPKRAPGCRWSKCRCWLGAGTFPTILSLRLCLYELPDFRMAAHSWLSKNLEGNLLHKAPYIPSVPTTYHLLHRGTYRNKLFLSWPDSTQWLTQLAELPVPHLPKQYSEPLIGRTVGL